MLFSPPSNDNALSWKRKEENGATHQQLSVDGFIKAKKK